MGLLFKVGGKSIGSPVIAAGPGFLSTMQIPLLAGRDIEDRDQTGVAVVNQLFAKQNFPGENPLGRHITLAVRGLPETDLEIVGVSADTRYGQLKRPPQPLVFFLFSHSSFPGDSMVYELRTSGDPLAYVNTVREIVRQADARVPLSGIKTQEAQIDERMNQEIIFARLCTAFALLALAIACVGLYGTMSYTVARRTNEIGIRMALGAQRARGGGMVVRDVD